MKILVTGAAGFIGSHLCDRLLNLGHSVVGIDSLEELIYQESYKVSNLKRISKSDKFSFIHEDLNKLDLIPHTDWADVVIHEAAMPGLTKSWSDFSAYNSANLGATQKLLEAITESKGTHLVHASTSSVYGKYAMGDESTETRPFSPYGVTKLAGEHLITAYRDNFGIEATILRYFSVYGPHQRPDMAYSKFCRLMLAGEAIQVTGDGNQSRTNTYIEDIVNATVLAAEQQVDGLIANICGTESITLNEAINLLATSLGVSPRIQYVGAATGDQLATCGDAGLAKQALGWAPNTPIREGLRIQAENALNDTASG